MLHAAAGGRQAGRMQRKKVRTASKQAIVDAVLLACTSSTSRCCGRPAIQKQNFCGCCVDLPCARRRTSKWPFSRRGGPRCYGWRAAVRSGKTVRKEGQRR